jgi:acetolactate decarboxylase
MRARAALAVALLCCQCHRPGPQPIREKSEVSPMPPSLPQVRVWGALRGIMHEGKTGPQVALVEAVSRPHGYAVGALESLLGEVTIVDGVVWLASRRADGGVAVEQAGSTGQAATLLVAANVPSWRTVHVVRDIDADGLDDAIQTMARENGLDVEKPFPVLIEGRLSEAKWHVLAGAGPGGTHDDHMRGAAAGTLRDVDGVLVGFFSRHHEGVFTHMGQRTHFHVLTADHSVMGHADRAGVRSGSTVKLPGGG